MTRKQIILKYLKNPKTVLSCKEICDKIIKEEKIFGTTVAHYLSGSVSTILAKLVKEGVLKYAEGTGPMGGHLYQKKESK